MAAENEELSLKSMFEDALKMYDRIVNGEYDNRLEQAFLKATISKLEDCTRLINAAQVFSSNETLEEVSTECVQYLAIPAMLGELVGKIEGRDRVEILGTSEIYFKDFLNRGKEYGFVQDCSELNEESCNGDRALSRMVMDRNEKIRKYEEQKKLESDLIRLKEHLENDDEKRREYFNKFVLSFVFKSEEELRSISMEKPLAALMRDQKKSDKKIDRKREPPRPLQAVIITKNELMKKVFGAGYPSIPTMTVDEFYTQRVKEGIFPAAPTKSLQGMEDPAVTAQLEEKEQAEKEILAENDDPESLERAREMDEFKDDHRRGWGNRFNRS